MACLANSGVAFSASPISNRIQSSQSKDRVVQRKMCFPFAIHNSAMGPRIPRMIAERLLAAVGSQLLACFVKMIAENR